MYLQPAPLLGAQRSSAAWMPWLSLARGWGVQGSLVCVLLALFLFELLVLKSLGGIRSGQKSERGEQRDCRIKERRNDQGNNSSFYQFWNLRDPNYRRKKKATVVQNVLQKTLQSEQLQKYLPRLPERQFVLGEKVRGRESSGNDCSGISQGLCRFQSLPFQKGKPSLKLN